jgi:hypothetical protein
MTSSDDYHSLSKESKALLAGLDHLTWPDLLVELGPPDRTTTESRQGGRRWQPGTPRPALATTDVAAVQAMARCLAYRSTHGGTALDFGTVLNVMDTHPKVCAWCDYPDAELEAAADWGGWDSGLVEIEYSTWDGRLGSHYDRTSPRQGTYSNLRWATFFSVEPSRHDAGECRRRAITAAMYGQPKEAVA